MTHTNTVEKTAVRNKTARNSSAPNDTHRNDPAHNTTARKITARKSRPRPFLFPDFCKACGRCIEACPKDCIHLGTEIDPATGLTPVTIDLAKCNACGLCLAACP
ncbi:MAG: ferredoxin family protein, partial [bacterium]|nr:ferredoxin family protein [bacterium]